MYQKRSYSGFSLLELLVVIAIISILTVIAIPCYQKYIIRAKIVHIFTVANYYKLQLTDKILNNNYQLAANITASDNSDELITKVEYLFPEQYKYILQFTVNMDKVGVPLIHNQPLVIKFIGVNQSYSNFISWSCEYNHQYAEWMDQYCAARL